MKKYIILLLLLLSGCIEKGTTRTYMTPVTECENLDKVTECFSLKPDYANTDDQCRLNYFELCYRQHCVTYYRITEKYFGYFGGWVLLERERVE